MQKETAQALLALLDAIDTDDTEDWIDLVCTVRESLPESTRSELNQLVQP